MPTDPTVTGLAIPGFRVERVLASGGYGLVLKAERERDRRRCALKVAHAGPGSAAVRLDRERRILELIGPPRVPELLGFGEAGGRPYLALELIQAPTLAERLEQLPEPLPLATLSNLIDGLLRTITTLHTRGVVHLDLKPENLFLREAEVAVIDFGTSIAPGLPALGDEPVGTLEYMAPEQLEAQTLDVRTDVYALGVILFELLTLRLPFWGSPAEIRSACATRRPPRPSSLAPVPKAIEEVVLRALAKQPDARFDDAAALRAAMTEAFLKGVHHAGRGRSSDALDGVLDDTSSGLSAGAAGGDSGGSSSDSSRRSSSGGSSTGRAPSSSGSTTSGNTGASKTRAVRSIPVLAFASSHPPAELRGELASMDAVVVQVMGPRFVVVVDADASNPLRYALGVARRILARGVCAGLILDVAPVRVRQAREGRRYFSATFSQVAQLLENDNELAGLLITPVVSEILSDLACESTAKNPGLLQVRAESVHEFDENTTFRTTQEMVGRSEPLSELLQSARIAVVSKHPTLATVVGDAGLGKTHLASSLVHSLRSMFPHARLLTIRGRDTALGDTGDTLVTLLRQTCAVAATPPEDRREIQKLLEPQVEDAWAPVAFALGWLPIDAPELAPFAHAPGALRSATTRGLAQALRRMAGDKGLLLVMDDAHFADATTLDGLELAALSGTRGPLWLCTLVRPDFESLRPMWSDRAAVAKRIELEPLGDDHAARICRTLLQPAENLPERAVAMIVRRAQGNPMLLGQLVRALKSEGIVRREKDSGGWILETDRIQAFPELPQLEWLATRQLEALPSEVAAHARLAARLGGNEFFVRELDGIVEILEDMELGHLFPLDSHTAIRLLDEAGIVKVSSKGRVTFRNGLVREAIAATVSETLEADLHRAAFSFYETNEDLPWEVRTARLAHHASVAGLRKPAGDAYRTIAEWNLARHRYVEAEVAYSQAFSHADDLALRLVCCHGRGVARHRIGRYADALDDLRAAREIAESQGDRAAEFSILLDEATELDWLSNFQNAADLVEAAAERLGDAPSKLDRARLEMGRARARWRGGRRVEARDALFRAAGAAEEAGEDGYEPLVISLVMLGNVLGELGEHEEASRAFDRILELTRAHGDLLHESAALNNRTTLWVALRQIDRAVSDLRRSVEIGRVLGSTLAEFYGTYNLAEILYLSGDIDGCWQPLDRVLSLTQRRPDIMPRPVVSLLEARVLVYQGAWDRALVACNAIAAAHDAAEVEGRCEGVLMPNEHVLLCAARLACAGGTDDDWHALRARSKTASVEQEAIEIIELQGLGAIRRRDFAQAAKYFDEAIAVAKTMPNIMEPRIERRRAAMTAYA
ncbi:MAG: protein kinase [Deltaproteobacteria bacterium]|nr:protein kinase [Deltaproteobacteria bacterium]